MISRLTAFAATFAIVATGTLTYAASAHQAALAAPHTATAKAVRVVQLERVVIVAKRLPAGAN
jgi:hypothetical protein